MPIPHSIFFKKKKKENLHYNREIFFWVDNYSPVASLRPKLTKYKTANTGYLKGIEVEVYGTKHVNLTENY